MAEQRSTPEEKLLKLIEKEDNNEAVTFRRKRNIFLGFSGFWFSLNRIFGQALTGLRSGIKEPNLKILNKLFLIISICLLFFSVVDFVINRLNIENVTKRGKHTSEDYIELSVLSVKRPFLHYLEMVQRRNIFSPIALKRVEDPQVQEKQLLEMQLQKMASEFGLVGISLDDEPMTMIEDKTTNKTYFLKQGDKIGEFQIETIFENKVILRLKDTTVELK